MACVYAMNTEYINKGFAMRFFGIICAFLGGIFALIALNMDVTVPTGVFGLDRVNNMGLMADRQNYLMLYIGAAIVGVLLIIFGGNKEPSTPLAAAVTSVPDSGMRACPFCAEPIKNEAIKCKHCGSVVEAVIVEQPKKSSFFDKPENMPWGEYREKLLEHYSVLPVGDSLLWRGTSYPNMQCLIAAIRQTCE